MSLFIFGFYKNKVSQTFKESSELDNKSYKDEFDRLEKLRDDSENLWEARTYQLAAGGLSLTFAVFSFLMGKSDKVCFEWPMAVIWGVYTLCILANYISHRVSIRNFENYIKSLNNDSLLGKVYDERVLMERYKSGDKIVKCLNIITEWGLILNVIFTVVYSVFIFNKI